MEDHQIETFLEGGRDESFKPQQPVMACSQLQRMICDGKRMMLGMVMVMIMVIVMSDGDEVMVMIMRWRGMVIVRTD